ncbi:phage tail collar domain protein [Janthinobacterium sp. HH01]|uniref:phage tail protein n=1 Tax=Janthinobacterium sp. HH01 TaxID=1198452 RepID=UPI0002AED5C0|nr:tail fiber protein [Janthinobacterium sp. HH01]ELX11135.1 phage tail collar domain protein [Janthinobacterium sp. HH01]
MSLPFLGEIRMFSFGFVPKGWARCDGQLLSINQNQALFSILGTNYGGNGINNFALPDLRGRMPMHNVQPGAAGGAAHVTLTTAQVPQHGHTVYAANDVSPYALRSTSPSGNYLDSIPAGGANIYHGFDGSAALHPDTVGTAGSSAPHENRQPYAPSLFCIALSGIFPSRN